MLIMYQINAHHISSLTSRYTWNFTDVAVRTLRDIRMNILPDSDCVSAWNSGGFNVFISSTMMCAGGDNLPSTCFVSHQFFY